MNMHVDPAELVVQELGQKRSFFARLILALRTLFAVNQPERGSWVDGARGL